MELRLNTSTANKLAAIDQLDPRLRIVLVFTQAVTVTCIDDIRLLFVLMLSGVFLCFLSSIKLVELAKRLMTMDGFLVVVLLTLPFTTAPLGGDDIAATFAIGSQVFTASQSGVQIAVAIFLKANAILLFLQALLGAMNIAQLCQGAALLQMPKKMVFLMAFTLRYLALIHGQYQRMRTAMKLRAFRLKPNAHGLKTMGYLIGMLLIRSLERSERIHQAMRCRGFVDKLYLLPSLRWRQQDSVVFAVVISTQCGVLMIDQYGLF